MVTYKNIRFVKNVEIHKNKDFFIDRPYVEKVTV